MAGHNAWHKVNFFKKRTGRRTITFLDPKRLSLVTVTCLLYSTVRHVTGNDEDYLRKILRVVVQKSALYKGPL
jgi:hypothetical protein